MNLLLIMSRVSVIL